MKTKAARSVTGTVHGHTVGAPDEASVMRAAVEAGVQIPKLSADAW